jgi:hypothetical protein
MGIEHSSHCYMGYNPFFNYNVFMDNATGYNYEIR